MKKKLLLTAFALLATLGGWAEEPTTLQYNGDTYNIKSQNLFTNGSFDDGVNGWMTTNYTTAAVASNFTITATGGWDNGAYITTNGAGVGSEKTIRQSVAVTSGKTYYFCVYTSGKAPSSNNFAYNALFKMTTNSNEDGVLTQFSWPQGAEKTTTEWNKKEFVFTADDAHPYVGVRLGWNASTSFDGFTLYEIEAVSVDLTAWTEAKTAAQTALNNYDATYATTERAAVTTAMNVADPTTVAGRDEAVTTLNNAVSAFVTKAEQEILVAAINRIQATGDNAEYGHQSTSLYPTDLSTWTQAGANGMEAKTSQHWKDGSTPYYEMKANWGSSWAIDAKKAATLPAGKYAFVITARAASNITGATLTIGQKSVALSKVGAEGFGIATNGECTYDNTKTYTNSPKGYGWEYAYIEFELTEEQDVEVEIAASAPAYTWISIANPVLYYNNTAQDAMEVKEARAQLAAALAAKTPAPTANIGTEAFKFSQAAIDAYKAGLTAAQTTIDNASATKAELETAKSTLEALAYPVVNAPAATAAYNIVMSASENVDWSGKAVTVKPRNDQGGYDMGFDAEPNASQHVQAFYFELVGGNQYKVCFNGEDGKQYVCNGTNVGSTVGWAPYQVRVTTDPTKAMVIEVAASPTEADIYTLVNTALTDGNRFVGSTTNTGFYCSGDHKNLNLVAATKLSIAVTPACDTWGTLVLPFAAELPDGLTAYSVEALEDGSTTALALTSVESLAACKPYIVSGTAKTFTGYSVAKADQYTAGWLTGALAATKAPAGSYVLQKQDDLTAFYHVAADNTQNVPANKCWLTVPAASGVKAFTFGDIATAINAIQNSEFKIQNCYDLQGRQLRQLVKGVNIVNGKKIIIK